MHLIFFSFLRLCSDRLRQFYSNQQINILPVSRKITSAARYSVVQDLYNHNSVSLYCSTLLMPIVSHSCCMEWKLLSTELNTLNYAYSNAICKIFKVSHCSVEDILHFTSRIAGCQERHNSSKRPYCKDTVVNFVCELCTF